MTTFTGSADANGFKIILDYTVTTKSDNSGWNVSMSMSLQATTSGKYFTSWTLTTYCGITESPTLDSSSNKQYSIPNLGTIQLLAAKNFSIPLGYESGTSSAPTVTIYGYCDADTNATYVPVNNSRSKVISLPAIVQNYTVTYNNQGTITTQSVASGSTGTFPSVSIPTGYTFDGWTSDYANYYTGSTAPISGPVTYVASFSPISYTVSFNNSYGSNGSTSKSVSYNSSTTFPNPGTRAGYTFNGWNNNSSYYVGASTPTVTGAVSYSADAAWTAQAPGFTENVSSKLKINQDIASTANRSVTATNVQSGTYVLEYYGQSQNPLSWLSIDATTGLLSGKTDTAGTYSFRVRATSLSGTSSYSNTITISVVYPGKRINSSLGQSEFVTAKRYDANNGWVPLTSMKKFIGIGQPGADANGWTNLTN